MVAICADIFAPYIGKLYNGVMATVDCGCRHPRTENFEFSHIVLDMLLLLFYNCKESDKFTFYCMLKAIVVKFDTSIREKDIHPILRCLSIGIDETDANVRMVAYNATMYMSSDLETRIINNNHWVDAFINFFKIMQKVCEDSGTEEFYAHGLARMKIFEKLRGFCDKFTDPSMLHSHTDWITDHLILALGAQNENNLFEEIIKSIGFMCEKTEENRRGQFCDELKPKIRVELEKVFVKNASTLAVGLAVAIGTTEFMKCFIGIALSLLDIQNDTALTTNLFALFGATLRIETTGFLSDIVGQMLLTLLQTSETNANKSAETLCAEKVQAIKSLTSFAKTSREAFEPHISECFHAVHDQLRHPEEVVRKASIDALAQFDVSFFQLHQIERSQEIASRLVPEFAIILKTDSATIAIHILRAYRLMCEPATVFVEEIKTTLMEKVFKCIIKVMCKELPCQANFGFLDNMKLYQAAYRPFLQLGKVIPTFEFAINFMHTLPMLRNQLKKANKIKSKNSEWIRPSIYRTLQRSVWVLEEYKCESVEIMFSLFFRGMKDVCNEARRYAVLGLGDLSIHSRTSDKRKSTKIAEELSNCLDNDKCVRVVDAACTVIIRLIVEAKGLIRIETFLPKIVEKLKKGKIRSGRSKVFKCFETLLKEDNKVLLTMLHSVIFAGIFMVETNDRYTCARECLFEVISPLWHCLQWNPVLLRNNLILTLISFICRC